MRCNCFSCLLEGLEIVWVQLTAAYIGPIHRELHMTARARHALIICCISLRL